MQRRMQVDRPNRRSVSRRRTGKKRRLRSKSVKRMTQADYIANAGLNIFGRVGNTPLPTKLKATLRFVDYPTLNIGAAGTPATHVYRASGLYDPDVTGVGAQPRGFDQLMTLYDHFVVIGSKITVKMSPYIATKPVYFAINLKDSGTTDANIITTTESSFTSWNLVSPSGDTCTLVQTYSPRFLGRSNPLSDPDLKGSDSASPVENAFYHVVIASPAGTDESAIVPFVCIEYTAVFIEPKRPPAS